MNRCFPALTASRCLRHAGLTLALFAGFTLTTPAQQQPLRIPPMTAGALLGQLRVTTPPEVLLNGKPMRLAPGARLRDRSNLMVVSGALIGADLPVRYTLDPLGLILEVWVLTPAEVAASLAPPVVVTPP